VLSSAARRKPRVPALSSTTLSVLNFGFLVTMLIVPPGSPRFVAARAGEAVHEKAHVRAAEAADGEVVPRAAEIVEPRDAADVVDGISEARRADVVDLLQADDAHRLRQFQDGRVRARGAAGAAGIVRAGLAAGRDRHLGHGRIGRIGRIGCVVGRVGSVGEGGGRNKEQGGTEARRSGGAHAQSIR
jgi:hypothetical protein